MKENAISGTIAVVATMVTGFLGGWDIALKVLVFCMVADYVTGVLGAVKSKSVSSDEMFWGGVRKGIILLVIMFAVLLDEMVGNASPIFRTIAIYFYVGREGLSIIENVGVLGVPLPAFLKDVLTQLNEKKGSVDDNAK